jgi:hypothetical protein
MFYFLVLICQLSSAFFFLFLINKKIHQGKFLFGQHSFFFFTESGYTTSFIKKQKSLIDTTARYLSIDGNKDLKIQQTIIILLEQLNLKLICSTKYFNHKPKHQISYQTTKTSLEVKLS